MSNELTKVVDELGREKGIPREILADALHDAICAAVAKKIGKYLEPEIHIDMEKGTIDMKIPKEVSESVDNKWYEIFLDDAYQYKPNAQLGDVIMVPAEVEDLGRQAALVAKQRLFERLREAEKKIICDEFEGKVGEIVNGTVLKTDRDTVIVHIGKVEAILPKREMITGDYYNRGDYVRALLFDIRTHKDLPQIVLSRTHPNFLKKMFEAEIPEVFEGVIEVKAVAREPGDRAKVAVYTMNSNIDAVGACIGMKGSRINAISSELKGEKIDVIEYSPDTVKFACNAISPADVLVVNIFEEEKTLEVVVPDERLSLAIGKRGQNVKLAAMITEWRLDVLKESEYVDIRKERMQEQEQELKEFYELYNLSNIEMLTENQISELINSDIGDVEQLSNASVDEIMQALSVDENGAVDIINSTIDYLANHLDDEDLSEEEPSDQEQVAEELPEDSEKV